MNRRTLRAVVAGVFAASLLAQVHAADAPGELHGSADVFATPGMAMAWSVLRGASDDAALVVLRIVTDPAVYSGVTVTGIAPFSFRLIVRPKASSLRGLQCPGARW